MSTESKISVAIVGGGIGGLCLAIALQKHEQLSVQIYEAAHKFSEIGAGVAFGPNAGRAIQLIGPDVEAAYLRVVTQNLLPEKKNVWFDCYYGTGEKEGQRIATPRNETGQCTLHRAKFLEELVKLVPEDICHFGKRLESIVEGEDEVELHFKDGSVAQADCVIGADGVHSPTRSHILGAEAAQFDPQFTGVVAYRGLVPMEKATAALGDEIAKTANMFYGQGGSVMTYPIDGGATMNVVAIKCELPSWEGPWVQKVAYERVESDFEQWGSTPRTIISLLDMPDLAAWSLWDLPALPTYQKGKAVIIGDAAHATTPFQGQGAGQAIEDAYVMAGLLGLLESKDQLNHAFKAYDTIRRPRATRVVQTSREAGLLTSLSLPGVLDDAVALKYNIEWRMDWIWHRDIAGELSEASSIFEKLRRGEPGMEHLL